MGFRDVLLFATIGDKIFVSSAHCLIASLYRRMDAQDLFMEAGQFEGMLYITQSLWMVGGHFDPSRD